MLIFKANIADKNGRLHPYVQFTIAKYHRPIIVPVMTEITDPFAQFDHWLTEAREAELNDYNAMALATVGDNGLPAVRMVLLKGHDADGFVFYTNCQSRKAVHLNENPQAAILFHWKSLRRQIRIEGQITPVSAQQADEYFASRSRASQLGAWASDQSRPLAKRALFEERYTEMEARFADKDVPRPPHWSGFRLIPSLMEFWEDRPHRLHHRQQFTRSSPDQDWQSGLLFP